ncbi:MAG: hypothetical protein NZ941_08420 [Candidatus Caldarchaeum sp.]|nr:hypothetical protein [Candidatus Caldarchaeum sp.]
MVQIITTADAFMQAIEDWQYILFLPTKKWNMEGDRLGVSSMLTFKRGQSLGALPEDWANYGTHGWLIATRDEELMYHLYRSGYGAVIQGLTTEELKNPHSAPHKLYALSPMPAFLLSPFGYPPYRLERMLRNHFVLPEVYELPTEDCPTATVNAYALSIGVLFKERRKKDALSLSFPYTYP